MTRRVLIVCYYFPPLGLAGVTRPLQLFKRLANHGYECHVLTVKPVAYYAYEPELLEGVDQTRIHRAGSRDPSRLMYLCGLRSVSKSAASAAGRFGSSVFPDSKRGWIPPAVRLGMKLHKEHKFDLLLSTSPPISAHLVALQFSKQTGVKWVADFRDLWSTRTIEDTYSSSTMVRRGQRLLEQLKTSAAAITAVNKSIADYVGTDHVITNGYDPELATHWSAGPDGDRFVIGLLGTFNEQLPVEPLLRCLSEMHARNELAWKRVHLVQVGRVDQEWLLLQLKRFDMADRCDMLGLQSRLQTIKALSAASLFYLGIREGHEDRITPARAYDLLASGRPILAYTRPNSELAVLLDGVPDATTFAENSSDRATEFVLRLTNNHASGDIRFDPTPEYARQYSWDSIAARFAALFDRLV